MTRKPSKSKRTKKKVQQPRVAPSKEVLERAIRDTYIGQGQEPPILTDGDKPLSEPVSIRRQWLAVIVVSIFLIACLTYFYLRSR